MNASLEGLQWFPLTSLYILDKHTIVRFHVANLAAFEPFTLVAHIRLLLPKLDGNGMLAERSKTSVTAVNHNMHSKEHDCICQLASYLAA